MKWLLVAIGAALLGAIAYLQLKSVKTTYVNGLAPYTTLPGRTYILEKDCYIFAFKSHDSDWPFLGSHATVPDLPAEVKDSNVGAAFPAVRIVGVLRVGERFQIASVRRDESRAGTTVTFELVFDNPDSRRYYRVDAYWIMDHAPEKTGGAPSLLVDYAVPLRKE